METCAWTALHTGVYITQCLLRHSGWYCRSGRFAFLTYLVLLLMQKKQKQNKTKKTLRDGSRPVLSIWVYLRRFSLRTHLTLARHQTLQLETVSLTEVSIYDQCRPPAAIIESQQKENEKNEVMTESCPRRLSLDLQLKWSRLKGRVH